MEREIQRFIQEELSTTPDREVGVDDELLLDGLVDSMGVMRLVAFVEQQGKVSVPPEDVTIENFRTIKVIAEYVRRRYAAARS